MKKQNQHHDVTIVTTCYNSENTIEEAIQSVFLQTMNPKFIIVDDYSTDSSSDIIRKMKKESIIPFEYIRLDKNVGCGMAKRIGIEHVDTEYVAFLDSDDILESKFVEYTHIAAKKVNADIVCTSHIEFGNRNNVFEYKPLVTTGGPKAVENLLSGSMCAFFSNAKLVSTKLCKNNKYSHLRFNEDADTIYRWFNAADKIVVLPYVLYKYRRHDKSLTISKKTMGKLNDMIESFNRVADFVKIKEIKNSGMLVDFLAYCMSISNEINNGKSNEEINRIASRIGIHITQGNMY